MRSPSCVCAPQELVPWAPAGTNHSIWIRLSHDRTRAQRVHGQGARCRGGPVPWLALSTPTATKRLQSDKILVPCCASLGRVRGPRQARCPACLQLFANPRSLKSHICSLQQLSTAEAEDVELGGGEFRRSSSRSRSLWLAKSQVRLLMSAPEQIAARLSATALVRSPAHHYRNRMVYDLRAAGAPGCELLSLPTVWKARCVVYRWAVEASSMPLGFCARLRVESQLGVCAHTD